LNYINGYTAKAHDSLDFRLTELSAAGQNSRWRMTYRLLCKSSPCVPEIYCDFAGVQFMVRSFYKDKVFAIVPKPSDTTSNESKALYRAYLASNRQGDVAMVGVIKHNFMQYARLWSWEGGAVKRRKLPEGKLYAIGVRFVFELLDNYIGQYCSTFFPHTHEEVFYYDNEDVIAYTRYYYGAMQYLKALRYGYDLETLTSYVIGPKGASFGLGAFPGLFPAGQQQQQQQQQ